MCTTGSCFLPYSYVSASVQCENCSHNDKSFPAIPNMPGSIGPKWFWLRPRYNWGLGQAAISGSWPTICFTEYSYYLNYCYWKTSFSVFIASFSSLSTKNNWRHNRHNHGRRWRKWPPTAPREALCSAPMLLMDGQQPTKIADVVLGGLRVCTPLKALLCSGNDASPSQHRSVLRTMHTLNSLKNYSGMLGVLSPIHLSCRSWAKGLMWGTRGPYPLAAAMVGYGCVGRWWPLGAGVRSIYSRNSNNCLWIFFIPT